MFNETAISQILTSLLLLLLLLLFSETLGVLERTLERINDDLMVKSNSLDLDGQCTQVREKLSQHPKLL